MSDVGSSLSPAKGMPMHVDEAVPQTDRPGEDLPEHDLAGSPEQAEALTAYA